MAEILLEKFYSKRNKIQLVDKNGVVCVRKDFHDKQNFLIEKTELVALEGFAVPKIIDINEQSIYMTYIEGRLLLESYLSATVQEAGRFAGLLGDFIIAYGKLRPQKRLVDMNFRNFILSKGKIFGVDFEEVEEGDIMYSVASAIAFAKLYKVKDSVKEGFEKGLLQKFDFEDDVFSFVLREKISFLQSRRSNL